MPGQVVDRLVCVDGVKAPGSGTTLGRRGQHGASSEWSRQISSTALDGCQKVFPGAELIVLVFLALSLSETP